MDIFKRKVSNLLNKNKTKTEAPCLDVVNFTTCFNTTFSTSMYSKIIYECADRTILKEEIDRDDYIATSYDNYSPFKKGLVSWVVYAMVNEKKVFLRKDVISGTRIYTFSRVQEKDATLDNDVIDTANYIELDFSQFREAGVINALFVLVSELMTALGVGVKISQGLLIKIHKLSEMINNPQNNEALVDQIQSISEGISQSKSTVIDAESDISFMNFDSSTIEKSAKYVLSLMSMITGMPNSFNFGEVVGGLGSNSDSDNDRMDSAIKRYFYSIWSGINYAVYNERIEYKPRSIDLSSAIEALTFIETTESLTKEGKEIFAIEYAGVKKDHLNLDSNSI